MIYLASPYSHKDPAVMAERAEAVAASAAHFMRAGEKLYCPIAAWHWVALNHDLPKDWPTWRGLDFEFLRHSAELWILMLDGWEDSVGVTAEHDLAEHIGLPVRYVDPENNTFPKGKVVLI